MGAFVFKHTRHTQMAQKNQRMAQEVTVLHETASLKKIWGDKRIANKLESIHSALPASKVTWKKRGRKLTATLVNLQPQEVNRIVSKILNVPIQIEQLKVLKEGDTYKVELRCKW